MLFFRFEHDRHRILGYVVKKLDRGRVWQALGVSIVKETLPLQRLQVITNLRIRNC